MRPAERDTFSFVENASEPKTGGELGALLSLELELELALELLLALLPPLPVLLPAPPPPQAARPSAAAKSIAAALSAEKRGAARPLRPCRMLACSLYSPLSRYS